MVFWHGIEREKDEKGYEFITNMLPEDRGGINKAIAITGADVIIKDKPTTKLWEGCFSVWSKEIDLSDFWDIYQKNK